MLKCTTIFKISWLNLNSFRVNIKIFLFLYAGLILCCFLIFRSIFGTKPIYDELNINSSRLVKDYVFPQKFTALTLVKNSCMPAKVPLILIIVCSNIQNDVLRQAIRKTWASQSNVYNIHVLFLVGQSKQNYLNIQAIEENLKYNDIIIENFIDSYYNLTVKSLMLLKWVKHNCQNARYVMKIDDDVYLNVKNLHKFVKSDDIGVNNFLVGKLYTNESPHRYRDSKWYIPKSIYPDDKYPHFLCGVGYLMSGDVALQLYEESFNQELIFIEDVFVTGICAEKIGLKRRDHLGFHFFEHAVRVECNSIHAHMVLLSHHVSAKEMNRIHNEITKCNV